MKPTVLAIALLACSTTHAGDLAKWKNGGATSVLTDERGSCIEGASVIRVEGPEPRTGCYTLDEKKVHVVWSDTKYETFPIRKFRPTRETIAAAEKERLDRDADAIRRGNDVLKAQARPPLPEVQPRPTTPPPGG